MDQNREELTSRIIGLGEKSIRKNYYPELKQRIIELEKRLQWQMILQKVLEQGNSCIRIEHVYSKFLKLFSELSWVSSDDCIYINYIPGNNLLAYSGKKYYDLDSMSVMYAFREEKAEGELSPAELPMISIIFLQVFSGTVNWPLLFPTLP